MTKRLYRELYLLSRGEQRALLLLSLLLIVSLACRILVGMIPGREPPGMEEFIRESRMVMAAMVREDSLQQLRKDSIRLHEEASGQSSSGYPARWNKSSRNTPPRQAYAGPIDLNRADSVQLLPLPGIGPVFARRIIKYRNLLGGYACVDQLKEVYGMKDETLDLIRDRILIDTSIIRGLDLNEATFRELLRHPYLEIENVKAIVDYREVVGGIVSLKEIWEHGLLADSTFERIAPYLYLAESFSSGEEKE